MAVAAVPNYLGHNFTDTPPGHRFGLYFDAWDQQWKIPDTEKHKALDRVTELNDATRALLGGLRNRQRTLADAAGDSVWRLPAQSTAPFMTGTGMEHPLENGFAFLNPYGLPYLPGSGVKGVLRRAAEELVSSDYGDPEGWNQDAIDALFGRETESGDSETTRNRGALAFWDVIPEPAGGKLAVDIMTPHYGDYYQGNATPHDSGQPNPILFLTVPPGSGFEFFVQCDSAALPESLKGSWQILLKAAFTHAFDWLGFGAKTAVGYGAMRSTLDKATESAPATREIQSGAASTPETSQQRWETVALTWNKGKKELQAATAQGRAFTGGNDATGLLEKLSSEQRKKLDKGKPIHVALRVELIGGSNWRILSIE